MTNTKNEITYALCEKCSTSALSTDFTLPDYQSEIRRVVSVFPTVLYPAKYVTADTLELCGSIDYRLLYVGMDGGLYSAPLSAPYTMNISLDGSYASRQAHILCELCADGTSARVSAPRRLTVKTNLSACVRILDTRPTDVSVGDGAPIESIYKKSESLQSLLSDSGTCDMIKLSYIVPDVPCDMRVVFADASVKADDITPRRGMAQFRGELRVSLLCVSEETNEYKTIVGGVPFDAEIDMERCSENSRVRAHGSVAELTVSITDAGIECTAGVILCGVCMSNTECEYVSDVFSSQNESECTDTSVLSPLVLECANTGFTFSERVPLSTLGIPADAHVLLSLGDVSMRSCEVSDGKCSLLGDAVFKLIYENESEVSSCEVKLPVKYLCDVQSVPYAQSLMSCCEVSDVRVTLSDGNARIDCEVLLSYDLLGMQKVNLVEHVRFGEAAERASGELAVCFSENTDTLWSVAKRYHVPPESVIGSPENDKYVLIEY